MRLLSLKLRHYRVHRELDLAFAPDRNLVGGPNESGKSTLVEAIHRGLFLRSRTGGEVQKSMVSRLPGAGHPEVEVRFDCGSQVWRVSKRFSGTTGTTQLQREGGETLNDAEADERLHELLQVEEVGTGRGVADRLLQQWSHLWVWQGTSGEDPTLCGTAEHPGLIQKLQEVGGAAAMLSAADDAVAQHFSAARESLFVRTGKPRKGSPLEVADTELEAAEAAHSAARQRLLEREQSIRNYETAVATINQLEASRATIHTDRRENAQCLERIAALRVREKDQETAAHQATEQLAQAERVERQIRELRVAESALRETLDPKQKALDQRLAQQSGLREAIERLKREIETSRQAARTVRRRQEFLRLTLLHLEKAEKARELDELSRTVCNARERHQHVVTQLANIPNVSEERLEAIRKQENALARAESALAAMAAGVTLHSADGPVVLDGELLPVGGERTITHSAEIVAGGIRLSIQPGGGASLATARQQRDAAHHALSEDLDRLGMKTIAEVSAAAVRRSLLQSELAEAASTLKHLGADQIEERRHQARVEAEAAHAEVLRRRSEAGATDQFSRDLATIRAELTALDAEGQGCDSSEHRLEVRLKAEERKLREIATRLEAEREAIARDQEKTGEYRTRLQLLAEQQGDDAQRTTRWSAYRQSTLEASAGLNETRAMLEKLAPEDRERDRIRLERASEQCDQGLRQAETAKAVAQTELRSDGLDDPATGLAEAEARLEHARNRLRQVRPHAEAIRLLDELFVEGQRALSERFSRPLADKITVYLRCLFGPGARAEVSLEKNAFTGIRLVRDGQGLDAFAELSGGAREQVAAAVRLAMAELLASDHHGCLPVVFDDAFAASDPARVRAVQRMLDHAAAQGIQLLILSCNPGDYAGLGATGLNLPAPGEHR